MRLRVVVLGTLGTLVTLVAAAAVFAPNVVQGIEPLAGVIETLAEAERRKLLFLASFVVGLFLSVASWRVTQSVPGDGDAFDEVTDAPPEAVTTARQTLTAVDLEEAFDAAVDGDEAAIERVRERLRETVVQAYALSTGCEPDVARTAVRKGEWTEDRTAAAALAGEDGPTHSLGSRLRLWLDAESERERRFDRTVQATTRLGGGKR